MMLCIGDEVKCPPVKPLLGKPSVDKREGTVVYIHPKGYFVGVKIKSISGRPVYTECFFESELSLIGYR